MLEQADSGIRLSAADSGITFEETGFDPSATLADSDAVQFESAEGQTQALDVSGLPQDSGFDVSLAEDDHTMEMDLSDVDDDSAKTKVKKGGTKSLSLSEAFQLDEPLEVHELDISEDLESAPESEYSGEFAEADEEVFEASDADFSGGELSIAEDVEEGESEEYIPAPKVRALPKEPAWGLAAVIPIVCASITMLITVTVLWGGVATMWTGGEATGLAGMLISTLGGLL